MSQVRRILAVGAVLALAALITLSQVWGEPAPGKDGRFRIGNSSAPADRGGFNLGEDLAQTKFTDQPVVTYRTKDGETLFALQALAKVEGQAARPRDFLILVDTSASQAQGPLTASRQIVEAVINSAQRDDRIAVWTVNTDTKDLTNGFKNKDAAQDAVKALEKEYPSGATNLKKALTAAAEAKFERGANRQRVVLFLGDGMSILDPIRPEDRATLAGKLAEAQVAFFPVPLGSRLDPQTLHGLASGTGGTAVRTTLPDQPLDVARKVNEAVAVPIVYPTKFRLSEGVTEHYPRNLPPLRADAPTLVVGKVKPGATLTYTIEGLAAGKSVKVEKTENMPNPADDGDNFFLVGMVSQWKNAKDEPALIRADRALAFALEQNQLARADLLTQARWALGDKNLEAAWRLFDQARQLDPNDGEAKAGINVVEKLRKGELTPDQLHKQFGPRVDDKVKRIGKDPGINREQLLALAEQDPKEPAKADPKQPPPGAADPDVLRETKLKQAVEDQRTQALVEDAIREAARMVRTDPQAANDYLKRTLDAVRNNEAISREAQRQLANRLSRALENNRVIGERVQRDLEIRLQLLTVARERALVQERAIAVEDRIRERMRVFDRLMDQAREEEAARQAQAIRADLIAQGIAVPVAVTGGYQVALNAHHLREMQELVRIRRERFLLTLMQVERSAVPFPDEPPIEFPPAAIWQAITDLRKEKYESSGFSGEMPKTTIQLRNKLGSSVSFGGFEKDERMTLRDALDQLSELYDITFDVNETAFKAEVPPVPEVLNTAVVDKQPLPKMRGVSLSTVLRKLLARIPTTSGATYIIRRDTIEITTGQAAAAEKTPRAYPVADLVIPIPNAFNAQSIQNQATILGFAGAAGFGGGIGGIGGFGFPAAGIAGIGGIGGFGFPAAGIAGIGGGIGFPAAGIGGIGGFQALGIAGGGLGGFGAGFGGAANVGFAGGGVNLGVGGGFVGFGGGQLGQFGNLGGQFGLQGGDQSTLLISLIQQVIGTPRDWAPLGAFQQAQIPGVPGGPPGGVDPNANPEGNSIGFFPPSQALVIKGTSRIHTRYSGPISDPRAQPPPPLLPFNNLKPNRPGEFAKNDPKNNDPLRDLNNRVLGAGGKRPDDPKDGGKPALAADLDAKKIWQDALARAATEPGLIIACADFLMEHGEFKHVAEFLKANLRQGVVVRPWVYEALAIALKESDASHEEVERAEVSVADLDPQDPNGLLRSAEAMAEHKRFDRALAFCRQASILAPNAPQTYADALIYAEAAKDTAAMEWAAGHLMRQDWPINNDELQRKAKDKLAKLVSKLSGESRRPEAERLVTALNKERQRDLVIHMKFQGEADLDLRVLEPTGSLCSCLNRQTVGGGTLIGDRLAGKNDLNNARKETGSQTETYVAAQAFSGEYKIIIDRVWGQPLGGKAQLEIIENQDTPRERRRLVQIDLRVDNTFLVNLAEGRRTETASVPPPDMQRPESPTERLEAAESVMVQLRDLAAPIDLGMERGIRGGAGSPCLSPVREPSEAERKAKEQTTYETRVAQFAPNTASLTAQAAISADRRYVRLSLSPMFRTVTGVRTTPVIPTTVVPGIGGPLP